MATMPREAQLELYLGGWVPITARQRQPITMTRGRRDWAGDVSPAQFTAEVDNDNGDLNPDNPLSIYWGLLNRNTPYRFTYTLLRDTFGRTQVDSWGTTTPDGTVGHATDTLPWTLSGTAADFDVGSGVATMTIAAANTKRRGALQGAVHRNIDVTVDIPTFAAPASGNNNQGITLRGTAFANHVLVEVDVTSASVVRLAIRDTDDNTYLYGPTTVTGVVRTSTMRLRAQVEGATIRGKVWNPSGDNEPYGFQGEATSTNMTFTGEVGLRAATGTGNTNVTFTFDNLVIRSVRSFGVTRRIAPRSDSTGRDKTVTIEGAGSLRRMERNKANALSANSIYVPTTSPINYWPMTGGSLTEASQSAVAGAPGLRPFVGTHPSGAVFAAPQWGAGSLGPWLEPGVSRPGGGSLTVLWAPVSMPDFTTTWTVDHIYASTTGGNDVAEAIDINPTYLGGPSLGWPQLLINPAGSEIGTTINSAPEVFVSSRNLFDGLGHHIRWTCTQNGGNVDITVAIDGGTTLSTSIAATLPAIAQIGLVGSGSDAVTFAHGHVGIWTTPPAVITAASAALGYRGETAGDRLTRLCADNNIPLNAIGDLDATATMGPQYASPLLTLLKECADTGLDTLTESRMAPGLVYRTHASLYNQSTAITLDYSAGQLTGQFAPDHDDQNLSNDVTARRVDGGSYRATQLTGPNNINDSGDDPDGVGTYDTPVTVNTTTDAQLVDVASWRKFLGTIDDPRVSSVTVNTASRTITAAQDAALLDLDVDDLIVVSNLTSQNRYTPLRQLGRGYTEVLDTTFRNTIEVVCAPASPYDVVALNDTARGKLDATDSALTTGYNSAATSLVASFTADRWTTTAAAFPIPITIAGEDMSLTAVSGTTSPQTLTVTRNAVTAKTLPSGSAVRLTRRATIAL